jgi:hypothetical protein
MFIFQIYRIKKGRKDMKRYYLLLVVFASSCTPNTSSPPAGPSHPFPAAFKEIDVSYQNLPGSWSETWSEWDYTGSRQFDTSWETSGNGLNDTFTYFFDSTNSFTKSGDTIRGSMESSVGASTTTSYTVIMDEDSGILDRLNLSWSEAAPHPVGNGLTCQDVAFTTDSSGNYWVRISGSTLQAGLKSLGSINWDGSTTKVAGSSHTSSQTYIDTLSSNAILTIRFVP